MDLIADSTMSIITSTSVSQQRSQQFHDGTLQGGCSSTSWCMNILIIRNNSILCIQITSLRAAVQDQGFNVQNLDIRNQFFAIFLRYNKIWYKTEWKWLILFSFQEKSCCSSNIDFYDEPYEGHLFHVAKFLKLWGRLHTQSLWWKNNLEKVCQMCVFCNVKMLGHFGVLCFRFGLLLFLSFVFVFVSFVDCCLLPVILSLFYHFIYFHKRINWVISYLISLFWIFCF